MAPAPPATTEPNPYELLGISQEATEAEIRSAYRSRSLKVHPDRNRNDPDAARKFHELTNASNLLLDPLRRLALDAQLRLAAAKKARFASYDAKRKTLVTELEERERELKKTRLEKEQERAARENENERVKEAGRRLREEKERERAVMEKARTQAEQEDPNAGTPPALGPYDTTIRVKFSLAKFPTLNTASALAAHLRCFGEIDEDAIVLLVKPRKSDKKKEKGAAARRGDMEMMVNAVVTFTQISAAFGSVSSGPRLKEQGMDVTWASGSEPPILQWLRDRGELGGKASNNRDENPPPNGATKTQETPQTSRISNLENGSKFSTFPSNYICLEPFLGANCIAQPSALPPYPSSPISAKTAQIMDYESMTLLRLREAERARLEREILEAEAREQES